MFIFYFSQMFINFFYFQTLQSLFHLGKRVWKHLIGISHFDKHILPSIDHFHFTNLKIPKKYLLILIF